MDQGGNINDARVGQNINQDNNRIEVPVYAWVIGFFVACFVGWYFFIKTDADEKCDTGFILENGKCVAVKMAEPITVPPGSVPLITPTGIVAVPAGPVNVPVVNVPVVNAGPDDSNLDEYKWNYGDIDYKYVMQELTTKHTNERNCAAQCRYHKDRCKAAVFNPDDGLCYLHDSLQPEHGGKGYRNEPGRHGVRRVAIKPSAVPVSEFVRNGATNSANKWRCGPVGSVGNGYGCTGDKFCTSHNWCESDQTKHTPNSDIRYRIYDGDI